MEQLPDAVARTAEEHRFAGVVRVDRDGETVLAEAFGSADRAFDVPNTVDTRFALASGVKGFTALTVMSLVEEGRLELGAQVREVLGDDLPEINDRVTVEQLLAHRSGIGDYVDEESDLDISDYPLPIPVHTMATTEGYLPALTGHPQKFSPGERFAYCNSGFVVLALVAERLTGTGFHDLVTTRVCEPAGMLRTGFLRTDELPGDVARGYLDADGLRTNALHLPVRGSGDGGIFSTAADLHRFWPALLEGRIVPPMLVEELLRPRSDVPEEEKRYGLGFWLFPSGDGVLLEGYDAGVSFRSMHQPSSGVTATVLSNTSEGAWPLVELLGDTFDD